MSDWRKTQTSDDDEDTEKRADYELCGRVMDCQGEEGGDLGGARKPILNEAQPLASKDQVGWLRSLRMSLRRIRTDSKTCRSTMEALGGAGQSPVMQPYLETI